MKRPSKVTAKPKIEPPSLFQPPKNTVKAIADRAEATSLARRSMAEATRAHAATVDVRPPADPATDDEYVVHFNQWLAGGARAKAIRERWVKERAMRTACQVGEKQIRLMLAAMDGRCRRLGEKVDEAARQTEDDGTQDHRIKTSDGKAARFRRADHAR